MDARPPTRQEQDQIALVQSELFEVMERLMAENFTREALLTGIAAAAADTAASFIGAANVPAWFRTNADQLEAAAKQLRHPRRGSY